MRTNRLLFFAEGKLGDMLLLTPALRAAKELLPGAFVSVLLFKPGESAGDGHHIRPEPGNEVYRDNPYVDEILSVDRNAIRSLRGFSRIRAELENIRLIRERSFDAVICTFPQNRFVLWAFLSRVKERIGQKEQQFSFLLTKKPSVSKSDNGVLKYYCSLVEALGIKADSYSTQYNIPGSSAEWAEGVLGSNGFGSQLPLIIVHPGAGKADRSWPEKHFAEMIDAIVLSGLSDVMLCCGEQDTQITNDIRHQMNAYVPVVKTGSIGDLAALLQRSDLCISNNSGPRHLAAAIGTRTLAILLKHDHKEWKIYQDEDMHAVIQSGSMCGSCPEEKCLGIVPPGEKFGAQCIHDIKVEDVFKKAVSMINP